MKEKELNLEFRILLKIYEDTVINKEETHFMKIVKSFKKEFTKQQIAKELNKSYNLGTVKSDQKKFGDKWARSLYISSESMDWISKMYKSLERPLPKHIVDVKEVQCICEFATECPHCEIGICRIKVRQKEEEFKKRKVKK